MVEGEASRTRSEAIFVAAYFSIYLAYLFWHQESEIHHWVSLVFLPMAGLWLVRGRPRLREVVRSVGLEQGRLTHGLKLPILIGLAFQVVQLLNAQNRAALTEILGSSWGWVAPLAALPLMMVLVGFTEEFFFRGTVQARFSDALKSDWKGVAVATVCFVLYHVPYAYLNPNWPSAGNLSQAFQLAAINGVLGGVILGWVYVKSDRNLVAVILLHAMVDWIPGTIMVSQVRFGGG